MSRPRQNPSLRLPPDDLSGFPTRPLSPETPLFRIVREKRNPWWFGSSMQGRFDLPEPYGTCYLAGDPLAALLELIGPDLEGGVFSAVFFQERRLRDLRVSKEIQLSDLTSRKASGFGVTAEMGSIVPYEIPQAWAARLHAENSGGVLYWLRHDPSRAEGYALFGPHGEPKRWRKGKQHPISSKLIQELEHECSIEVLSVPRSRQLRIIGE
ncbi:MAG TPA: RES family NAD+ phosphorylase [Thermoanaerobaculia bacterium]|nr:RES family NAD+ phosphorylase [Thermoanaerobaculia bacterium]